MDISCHYIFKQIEESGKKLVKKLTELTLTKNLRVIFIYLPKAMAKLHM